MSACKVCGEPYEKTQGMRQVCCSPLCASKYPAMLRKQKIDKETRAMRKELNESKLSWWLKKAQADVNAYIRARDAHLPCISCGDTNYNGGREAGHYRAVGSHPELRFNLDNINVQCTTCNRHLSGNPIDYRIGLVKKIGLDAVEALEGYHAVLPYTIEQMKCLRAEMKTLTKQTLD